MRKLKFEYYKHWLYKIILGLIPFICKMRRTLTIRTLSFRENQNKGDEAPLHATCRLISRAETVTTERQSLASRVTKGATQKHYNKRLNLKNSQNLPQKRVKAVQQDKMEFKKCQNKRKSRYQKNANQQQEALKKIEPSSQHFRGMKSATEPPQHFIIENNTNSNFIQMTKKRIKSQPNNSNGLKSQLMGKVSKKIELLRKMTLMDSLQIIQPIHYTKPPAKDQDSTRLFNFDKMYDYCLRKLNQDIKRYERNVHKPKDKKYHQLKLQSNLITKELVDIRRNININIKTQDGENRNNMGVVGSFIELSPNKEKSSLKKQKKKVTKKLANTEQSSNPFLDTRGGWQVGDKPEYFYLCE